MANPVPRAARMPPASRRAALATWCMLLRRRSRARGRCVDLPDASLKDSAVGPGAASGTGLCRTGASARIVHTRTVHAHCCSPQVQHTYSSC
uniref:Putative secreted protein n=1 Tax=Ixodes ricinus TaxID=34613 RepID=A0A6B0U4C2_IXORI